MSLIREKSYDKDNFAASNDLLKQIAEDWGMPFEVDADNDTAGRIYLDREKDIFIYGENYTNFWFCHTADSKIAIRYVNSYDPEYFCTDCNPDKTVLYLRGYKGSNYSGFIVAKDKGGNWACMGRSIIIVADRSFDFTRVPSTVNSNLFSSMYAAPNVVSGEMFKGLYRVFTAQAFSIAGSYFNFGGKIYRFVDATGGISNNPDYAFEARQE